MESLYKHTGISINFYNPQTIYASDKNVVYHSERYSSYVHELGAIGGFISAQTDMPLTVDDADIWYDKGLGRKVKAFNYNGDVIWQGFVNELTITAGPISSSRGPLVTIGNIVGGKYSPINPETGVVGSEVDTPLVQDTVSQGLYGKWEKWVSIGQAEEAAALQVRDVFLADMRFPKSRDDASVLNATSPVISLSCIGDVNWLSSYVYNNATMGLGYLSDKLKAILAADPNSVISTNYNYITDNLSLVVVTEDMDRFAIDIIKELLAIGNDTTDDRRIFGVFEEGLVIYGILPTTIEYYHYIGDVSRKILDTSKSVVFPWDVKAGKWLQISDFAAFSSNIIISNLQDDIRNRFLETVRYTAPYSLDLSAGRNDKLSQMLAKIAYSGGML